MKQFLFLFLFLTTFFAIKAQQIVTSGGNTQKEDFSAEWIIGGSLIDNSILSSGDEENLLSYEIPNISIIDVYPTITRDFITVAAKDSMLMHLNFKIFNSQGVNIIKGIIDISTPHELDLKDLAAGHYIIVFNKPEDQTIIFSKKIIKI